MSVGEQYGSTEEYWGGFWPDAGRSTGGAPPVDRVNWTQYPGHGPGAEFLGAPSTALELGSANLAESRQQWDAVFSDWGASFFIDPEILLPLILPRLNPGGVLAFSCVEALHPGYGPQVLYGNGYRGRRLAVVRWMFPPAQWIDALERHGYVNIDVRILPAVNDDHVGTLMGRAYRAPACNVAE